MVDSIFQRLFGRYLQPTSAAEGEAGEVRQDVRDYAQREVAAGFSSRAEIREPVQNVFSDEIDSTLLESWVPELVDEAIREHARAQLGWPTITDCDRLDAAFLVLEADGVVARQNYSCCGTCGAAEIWGEMIEAQARGESAHAYTFYHVQDTESAVEGSGLCLNYGSIEDGETAALATGHLIVDVLQKSGLTVDWNGSWDRRIRVDLDWKRRRTD